MNLRNRSLLILVTAVALFCLGVGSASAASPALTPGRTIPMSYTPTTHYTVAPDGTIWVVRGTGTSDGTIWHVDGEGHVLSESAVSSPDFYPLGIGYYAGRIYVSTPGPSNDHLFSWPATEIGVGTLLSSDFETGERLGTLGFYFRISSNGVITAALGQSNKVALLNAGTTIGSHPYYPQTFMGAGINKGYEPTGNAFESCVTVELTAKGTGTPCGRYSGASPLQNGSPGFGYPADTAAAPDGLYVVDGESNDIVFVDTVDGPAPSIANRFGTGGSGAGQILEPISIVRDPATGDLYVADQGNRRIDVFNGSGGFIAAYGYGVLDGADSFEVCGVGFGSCQAGLNYSIDPRSYFTSLDLGPDGLYAYQPLENYIQVFAVSETASAGSGGTASGSGGSSSSGPGATPAPIATPKPVTTPKCPKGKKAKKVRGKMICVKVAKHKKHHHRHRHHPHP